MAKADADGPVWTGDSFSVELTSADGTVHTIYVGLTGIVTDATITPGSPSDYLWQSEAVVKTDLDGTPDDSRDRDEDWVVEMAVPFRTLGLAPHRGARMGLAMKRCDVQGRQRRCGSWGRDAANGVLVLE